LGVHNEEELIFWTETLDDRGVSWTGFKEPDIGNQLTAIATIGDDGMFNELPLL
jgi:hypothetical protein